EVLDRVVRRCLDPDPQRRYQTAAEVAHALAGCGEHRRMEKALPRARVLTTVVGRHPFLLGGVLLVVPHVLGSMVNITYNAVRIVNHLQPDQQQAFTQVLLGYNLVVYPLCLWLVWRRVAPIYRGWQSLAGPEVPDADAIGELRRRLLWLPLWAVVLACV